MKRRGLGLIIVVFALLGFVAPVFAADENIVVVSDWGGTLADAYRKSSFDAFEQQTGIKVVEVESTNNMARIKAMVESKNVDTDLMEGSEMEINMFKDIGYLEQIEYSQFPAAVAKGMTDLAKNKYGCGTFAYASVIAYRTDVFSKANHPKSWADFWDVKRFPGLRTMVSGSSGDYPPLEYALLADGVSPKNLYPLDESRAFKALDKIKPSVLKWWTSGSQAAQLLLNKEVVLAEAFSGRIADLKKKGAPVEIEWNQGMLNMDFWLMPKGAPHKANAMKLLAFMSAAAQQAKFSELSGYGPVNVDAYKSMSAEVAANLPTSPDNLKKLIPVNNVYWSQNMARLQESWQEWEAK
jgi:putative spermidine/putrescine transport system substrate-binding protein